MVQLPTTLEEAEKRLEETIVKRAMFKRKITEVDKKIKDGKQQFKDLENNLKKLNHEREKLIRDEGKAGQAARLLLEQCLLYNRCLRMHNPERSIILCINHRNNRWLSSFCQ